MPAKKPLFDTGPGGYHTFWGLGFRAKLSGFEAFVSRLFTVDFGGFGGKVLGLGLRVPCSKV